jgi:hypothetical protein
MDVTLTTADKWMKLVGEYGLSILFLGCTIGILLYTAIVILGLCKKWIPKWIASSVESHDRIAKAVESQCTLLAIIHDHTHATKAAAEHSVKAAKLYKDIPSAVMVHLNNAEDALKERNFNRE